MERFLLNFIISAYKQSDLPLKSFGCLNAIYLYLKHPCYSPFNPNSPVFGTKESNLKQLLERDFSFS